MSRFITTAAMAVLGTCLLSGIWALAVEAAHPAEAFGAMGAPVAPISESTVIAEAEEFSVKPADGAGGGHWQPMRWGQNYYCATFSNTFLSRKAFLGAPEQAQGAASIAVRVPKAGSYLALIRYEAAPRFQTQFHLRIEQAGAVKLDRLYGARKNGKIWPFHTPVQPEWLMPWGAVENVVWEGHDAFVELDAGEASLILSVGKQPEPAAKRNVDLVMLTSDVQQVSERIAKENYLPLDGMLTQAGDVYLKLHNAPAAAPVQLTIPPGREHSPYWVHIRDWKPKKIEAQPGQSTDWVEVGSLLDTLNDGQWAMTAKGDGALRFSIEIGVGSGDGKIDTVRRLDELAGDFELAYRADTRYSREIRTVMRPADRGTTDDSMAHFIPTEFHRGASTLIGSPAAQLKRPVLCSEPLVETMVIRAPQGIVIPLVNWSGQPIKRLTLKISIPGLPTSEAKLASGAAVVRTADGYAFDLETADALILR